MRKTMEQLTQAEACLKRAKELLKEMSESLPPVEQGDSKAPPTQKSLPLLILDFDLIAGLRQQRRHEEADRLLRSYHRKLKILREKELKDMQEEKLSKKVEEEKIITEHERFLKKESHI